MSRSVSGRFSTSLPAQSGLLVALLAAAFWLDDQIVEFFNRPISSGQTKAVLQSLRCWGDGATIVLVAAAIALAQPLRRKDLLLILFATLATGAVVDCIKPITARLRPDEAPSHAKETWFENRGRNSSFPSGHAATAFAFARGLSLAFPTIQPVCLVAASGTAISRIYEKRHYLSDCVAGAIIGWYIMSLTWNYFRRRVDKTPRECPASHSVTSST